MNQKKLNNKLDKLGVTYNRTPDSLEYNINVNEELFKSPEDKAVFLDKVVATIGRDAYKNDTKNLSTVVIKIDDKYKDNLSEAIKSYSSEDAIKKAEDEKPAPLIVVPATMVGMIPGVFLGWLVAGGLTAYGYEGDIAYDYGLKTGLAMGAIAGATLWIHESIRSYKNKNTYEPRAKLRNLLLSKS